MDHLGWLAFAGFGAGALNALAGGGSFVSLPAMIAAGVPSVQANASSTVALFPGGLASAWAYREGLGPVGEVPLKTLMVVTLLGGSAGAGLLLVTPTATFDRLLPWLLLVAFLALCLGRTLGEWLRLRLRIRPWAVLVLQFWLGIYGGYFGGAVGIMMVAVWGLLDPRDLKSMSAPRTLLVSTANLMAVAIFAVAHAVAWPAALAMLSGATVGGYAGAQLGLRAPARVVRTGTLLLTAGITLAVFIRAYH
jgi:uncharacterized membrane protein YfcA